MPKKRIYDYADLSNKFTLSFEEAQSYFRIGEKRLRDLIKANPDADWLLFVGNRHYIKRPLFERYLARVSRV